MVCIAFNTVFLPATLFREMLHYNQPRGPKGAKKDKNLLQNVRKHTYIYIHFLTIQAKI